MKKLLVIGAGSIGERHLRCFRLTERVDVGFVEINPELASTIRQRYPGSPAYPSLVEALKEHWDAAVIATPAPFHVSQAIELLERGIHVLIEKPLSIDLSGIEELRRVAATSGRVVSLAYVHRANPFLSEMRQALQSGKFGKPVQLVATTGHHFPTARPAYARIYYARREQGGGAVQDALTHVMNIGEWLCGEIQELVADISHQVLPEVNVEDTAHVLARHGNVLASYALNQYQAPTEVIVTVICERGTLRYEAHNSRWRSMESPDSQWVDSQPMKLERDALFVHQANAFLDSIEGKSASLCSLEEGIQTLKVNLAVLASAETHAWKTTASVKG